MILWRERDTGRRRPLNVNTPWFELMKLMLFIASGGKNSNKFTFGRCCISFICVDGASWVVFLDELNDSVNLFIHTLRMATPNASF